MQIHLGGHLHYFDVEKRNHIQLEIAGRKRLQDVCLELGVPPAEVALAVINGNIVDIQEAVVENPDRVELFSPLGGG